MTMFARGISMACLLFAMSGCASTPQATAERDELAKQFAADPEKGTVYIYRPGVNFDNNTEDISSVLYIDQRLIGSTLAGVYFLVQLAPGTHVLSGIANDQGKMTLQVEAGRLYFVSLQVLNGSSVFTQVGVDTGKREVSNCCTLYDNAKPGGESPFPTFQL